MPVFRYEAVTQTGQPASGELEAETHVDVVRLAKTLGHYVTKVHDKNDKNDKGSVGGLSATNDGGQSQAHTKGGQQSPETFGRISGKMRTYFWGQLAMALRSGLEIIPSLKVVATQAKQATFKAVIDDIIEQVEKGESLSSSLKRHPRSFRDLDVAMVRVGETGGVLVSTTAALAKFSKKDQEVRNKLQSAAAYPVFVLVLAMISLMIILAFVLPKIMSTILENGDASTLPWPTKVLLTLSDLATSPTGLFLVVGLTGGFLGLSHWTRSGEGKFQKDRLLLNLPMLGPSFAKVSVARFARTLGTLLAAGVPVMEALGVVRDTLGNEYLAREIDRLAESVREGESIAGPLSKSELFPPLLSQVIAMGERTGQLDELLLETAESYEMESEAVLQMVLSILPVFMIVGLAVMIVFVLAGVLLPMVEMSQGIG